jgi:hypothetical protein
LKTSAALALTGALLAFVPQDPQPMTFEVASGEAQDNRVSWGFTETDASRLPDSGGVPGDSLPLALAVGVCANRKTGGGSHRPKGDAVVRQSLGDNTTERALANEGLPARCSPRMMARRRSKRQVYGAE